MSWASWSLSSSPSPARSSRPPQKREFGRALAEPELCYGHAIEPGSQSSLKCPVEGRLTVGGARSAFLLRDSSLPPHLPAQVPAPRGLRHGLNRTRLRHHRSRCSRRLRRHHARPDDWGRVPAAAVHDAHPRTAGQPPLHSSRRRRRPAHPHPT